MGLNYRLFNKNYRYLSGNFYCNHLKNSYFPGFFFKCVVYLHFWIDKIVFFMTSGCVGAARPCPQTCTVTRNIPKRGTDRHQTGGHRNRVQCKIQVTQKGHSVNMYIKFTSCILYSQFQIRIGLYYNQHLRLQNSVIHVVLVNIILKIKISCLEFQTN